MAWTSSSIAQFTTSSTDRSCPRWMISQPDRCRMRRMMLMAASWPSKREAAVTMRIGCPDRVAAASFVFFGCVDSMRVSMEHGKVIRTPWQVSCAGRGATRGY